MSEETALALVEKPKINLITGSTMAALLPVLMNHPVTDLPKIHIIKDVKQTKKCFLKTCNKEHSQRGAFCCAEHQREWRFSK